MQSFSRDLLPGDGGHPRMTAVAVSGLLGGVSEGQVPFRFVRHLPVRCHHAAQGTGLRAGVGQTLGEETAGRGAVPRGSYSSMAIVGGASVLVAVMRSSRWSAQPGQSRAEGPTRCFAAGLMRLARALRHRTAKAVPAGCLERSVSPALRYRSPSSVMGRASVEVARESTGRARRSARWSWQHHSGRRRSTACHHRGCCRRPRSPPAP